MSLRSSFYALMMVVTNMVSSYAAGTVTVQITSYPQEVSPSQFVDIQVRIMFTGVDNNGPWQVNWIRLYDDDVIANDTIASVVKPFNILALNTWYTHTFRNVNLGAWDDGGNGVELYAEAEVDDNDIWLGHPNGRSAVVQVAVTDSSGPPPDETGSLRVNIQPSAAVNAGAQWWRDGDSQWRNSGATVSQLPVGAALVHFNQAGDGWMPPPSRYVTITTGQTTTETVTYERYHNWGLWEVYRSYVLMANGTATNVYSLWDGGPGRFQGVDLGEYNIGGELYIDAIDLKTWKREYTDGDVTAVDFYYRVYLTSEGGSAVPFTRIPGEWLENLWWTDGDQKWGHKGPRASDNLLQGLTEPGVYTLELYGQATGGTYPSDKISDNNNGSNYKASFRLSGGGNVNVEIVDASGVRMAGDSISAVQLAVDDWSDYHTAKPLIGNPVIFSEKPYGRYSAYAYAWDMVAARATFDHNKVNTTIQLICGPRRPLGVTALSVDGSIPLTGHKLKLYSHDGDLAREGLNPWIERASGVTGSTGNYIFYAWPTMNPGEKYKLELINQQNDIIATLFDVRLDDASTGSSYFIRSGTNGGESGDQVWGLWEYNRSYVQIISAHTEGSTNWYSIWNNEPGSFHGASLGMFPNTGASLMIGAYDVKTWKNVYAGGDVTGVTYYYAVYETGNRPQYLSFTSLPGNWLEELGENNQKWGRNPGHTSVDILLGLSPNRAYTLELYGEVTGGTMPSITYDNNGGDNYKANFTLGDPENSDKDASILAVEPEELNMSGGSTTQVVVRVINNLPASKKFIVKGSQKGLINLYDWSISATHDKNTPLFPKDCKITIDPGGISNIVFEIEAPNYTGTAELLFKLERDSLLYNPDLDELIMQASARETPKLVARQRHVRPGQKIRLNASICTMQLDLSDSIYKLDSKSGLRVLFYVDNKYVGQAISSDGLGFCDDNASLLWDVPASWRDGYKQWHVVFEGDNTYAPVISEKANLIISEPPWGSESAPYGIVDHFPEYKNNEGKRRDDPGYRYRYARFGVVIDNANEILLDGTVKLEYPKIPSRYNNYQSGITDYRKEYFVMRSPRNVFDSEPERCFSPDGEYLPWSALNENHDSINRDIVFHAEAGYNYHLFRRLHLGEDRLVMLKDENNDIISANTENIFIIIHGWNRGTYDDPFNDDLKRLASKAHDQVSYLLPVIRWQIVKYDWGLDASTGGNTSAHPGDFLNFDVKHQKIEQIEPKSIDTYPVQNATEAAEAALNHGEYLGKYLLTLPKLQKVQLVAHSAGTWVAVGTARKLLDQSRDIDVQVTLLDPFIPLDPFLAQTDSALSAEIINKLANGLKRKPVMLENYYSKWDVTAWFGETAARFEWAQVVNEQKQLDSASVDPYSNHSGPIDYYADSIPPYEVRQQPFWDEWSGIDHGWNISMPNTAPVLSVAGTNQDFGSVQVGNSAERTFTVQNVGGGTLSGSASVLSPFSIVSGGTYNLAAGASQNVTVRYTPSLSGSHSQSVTFTGGGGATRAVIGSAYSTPTIAVTPSSLDFGSIQAGATKDLVFSVLNSGEGTLSGSATVSAPFLIISGGTYNLAAGASQNVTVRYAPSLAGTHNQILTFTGGGGASHTVSGSAYVAPVIAVTPSSRDFGSIEVGATSERQFTVENVGGGTLSGAASVSAPFAVVSGGSYNLGAGQSQTVTVRYAPTSAGTASRSVTFSGGAGASRAVNGSAYVAPVIAVTPSSRDFGAIEVGDASEQSFTVENVGGGTLSGSVSVSAPFHVLSGGSYSLGAGQAHEFIVRYSPTAPGRHGRNLILTGGGGAFISCSGTGVNAAHDIDQDGIPDAWEEKYFGSISNAAPHMMSANGRHTLWQSYIANMDPTDPSARPPHFSSNARQQGRATFTMEDTMTGRVYGLVWHTNLAVPPSNWHLDQPEQTGTGSAITFETTNDAENAFFRWLIRLPE